MSTQEEWKQYKLERLEYLKGSVFRFAKYAPPSPQWDHDHCAGCWKKFTEAESPESEHTGYVVALPAKEAEETDFLKRCREQGMRVVGYPTKGGMALHWVCAECFEEFKQVLEWKVESPPAG